MISDGAPNADAGNDQVVECTGPDGAFVMLDGSGSSPSPTDGTYIWSIDGLPIAGGVQPDFLLSLGEDIEVTLTVSNDDGQGNTDTVQITVQDIVAPLVSADMVQAGNQGHKYDIVATATDVCDPTQLVEAGVGAAVSDGASITIAKPDTEGVVRFMSSMVELDVKATDASGNTASVHVSPRDDGATNTGATSRSPRANTRSRVLVQHSRPPRRCLKPRRIQAANLHRSESSYSTTSLTPERHA